MTPSHATPSASQRTDPFRWPRGNIQHNLDRFNHTDQPSQRAFARQAGIPHATFNYWTRHYSAAADDPVACFFRSAAGEAVLRRIVVAALVTFHIHGAAGIRPVGTFLEQAGLDRFVACSRGALHPLAARIEADLIAFRDSEQPALAQQMKPKTITLVADEHFHSERPCLVGQEPVSGFIVVERYCDHRDAVTWQASIAEGTTGMPVEVVQLTSDKARALICCAEKGLQAVHSPDLFHDQQDLLGALLLPLLRPIRQAEKDLHKATQRCSELDGPLEGPLCEQELQTLIDAVWQRNSLREQLQQAKQFKEEAVQQVRLIGDDYHPFDRHSGKPVTAEEVRQRFTTHLDRLAEVVQQAGLSEKAKAAVHKTRTAVATLVGCVAWFWSVATARLEEMDLSEVQEQLVREKLLAGHYWTMAARRARTAQERKRLKEMAERLKEEAWQDGGALAALAEEDRREVQRVAVEIAGLFQRSSSAVEGRNGRLSLQHHGHSRVNERRLKALTVIHNYVLKRGDGTTAAQRFFGQEHKDVFEWLLQRLPNLPRPAAKRSKKGEQ